MTHTDLRSWYPGLLCHPALYQPFQSASLCPRRTMLSHSQPLLWAQMEKKIQPPARGRTGRFQALSEPAPVRDEGPTAEGSLRETHQAFGVSVGPTAPSAVMDGLCMDSMTGAG